MDTIKFQNLIQGKFDDIPKQTTKCVRIFLSSTFSGNVVFRKISIRFSAIKFLNF